MILQRENLSYLLYFREETKLQIKCWTWEDCGLLSWYLRDRHRTPQCTPEWSIDRKYTFYQILSGDIFFRFMLEIWYEKRHLGRIHVVVDEGVNDGGKLGLDDEVTGGLKVRNESSQSFADLREITTELITRHHSTGSPPRWRQQSAARWCRWWWSRPGPAWCPCRCCRSTHSWAGPGQRRRGWERRGRGGPGSTSTVAERERGGMFTFIITRDTVTYYYKVEDKRDVAEF